MTTSLTGNEKDDLIRSLTRQLSVAQAEANLHLAEVRRFNFIVSEITEAAEGGIFVRQNIAGDYMWISEQLAEILGYGDIGMPHSYRQFLEQIHPDDLDRALEFAAMRKPVRDTVAQENEPGTSVSAQTTDFPENETQPTPEAQASTTDAQSVLSLPSRKPIPENIFITGPGTHLEFRYLNQQGDYRWFRASAKRYQPEAGPEQIIGLILDIHDVKLLEAQRRAVNEELKAFMYSVAHDLRAPVRHIASFAEAIREEDGPTEERNLYLGYVEQSAEKLGKMIDGLLKLSKNQNYVPRIAPVNIEEMLTELISKTRQTEHQAPELIIEHDKFPIIETDADLIEQVLQNLLSNAVKYSSNEPRAVVNIRYYLQEAQHIISFSDNGIGFDPAYADKLFKLFSRLYVDNDIPGTGVGLASVHRIVRNLNGVIEADGIPGKGATFTLRLPVKVGATSAF
ncbi:sensor histidine kinase [Neolewinella aurantiaca]|nr:PAS domain-containing sensor histidine kinase [Neolewinella aurantiaca]